ncbi:unnamed protein product [Leuciscus chuanchicus]
MTLGPAQPPVSKEGYKGQIKGMTPVGHSLKSNDVGLAPIIPFHNAQHDSRTPLNPVKPLDPCTPGIESYCADRHINRPGNSRHQVGTAHLALFDYTSPLNNNLQRAPGARRDDQFSLPFWRLLMFQYE